MKIKSFIQLVRILLLGLVSLTSTRAQKAQEAKAAYTLIRPYVASDLKELSDTSQFRITDAYVDQLSGCTLVYAQQKQNGVPIENTMLTLAFKQGKLVSKMGLFKKSASASGGRLIAPTMTLSTGQAIDRAKKHLLANQITDKSNLGLRSETVATMKSVEAVRPEWVANQAGTLVLSWRVVLESVTPMAYYVVHVDAQTGQVIQVTNLVNYCRFGDAKATSRIKFAETRVAKVTGAGKNARRSDAKATSIRQAPVIAEATYNVVPFAAQSPLNPGGTPRQEKNPWKQAGVGNPATTYGWHFDGVKTYDSLKGNNTIAYFFNETTSEKMSLASSSTYPKLTFAAPIDLHQSPQTTPNRNGGLTNLFYNTNIYHDILYQYGFDEVAGNMQQDNMGRGGVGGDALKVQNVAGLFNQASMFVPADGTAPILSISLAKPSATDLNVKLEKIISVQSPANIQGLYEGREYDFEADQPNLLVHTGPVSGKVVYYTDLGGVTHVGCTAPTNASALKGAIALLDYDASCEDSQILHNAQAAGAIAILLAWTKAGPPPHLYNTIPDLTIPVVVSSQATGTLLKQALQKGTLQLTLLNTAAYTDAALQNDVISHEFGHAVSTRLAGGPATSTCFDNKESLSEGYTDFFAMMLTTDWSKATPSDGQTPYYVGGRTYFGDINAGLRTYPFSTDMTLNPRTYADVATANYDPYVIGGSYISAMWDMVWALNHREGINPNIYNASAKGGNSLGLKLVMTGLKLMPCGSGLLDGRDGILKADSLLFDGLYSDTIWTAFARRRGMGLHARQGSANQVGDEHVSFDTPLFLKGFSVIRQNNQAHLTWTAYGRFIDYQFVIEKSLDGKHFTPVGNLTATPAQKVYTFSEPVAATDHPFYRIKYTNDLGQIRYSDSIRLTPLLPHTNSQLRVASDTSDFTTLPLTIYPNPNSGQFQARFWAPPGQLVRLQLVDLNGHTLQERSVEGEGSYQEVSLSVPHEAGSTFVLYLQAGAHTETHKVISRP